MKLLDVDLRRPLVDAPAAAAANALAAAAAATDRWRLVGTSVDSARPMALLMSPDGTTHWFAAGEHADDGMEVKRVTSLAATIVVNGQTLELKLPQSPPDPFAVGGSAP